MRTLFLVPALLGGAGLATIAAAQYAGQQSRPLKALSEEELAQLREGAGMGLARVAELNHYPGPKHVLELARELELDEAQARRVREIHAEMHGEAVSLGERVVAAERELEALFAGPGADVASLERLTSEIGRLRGQLRAAHLRAHIATRALLGAGQVARYDELRGYAHGKHPGHHQ